MRKFPGPVKGNHNYLNADIPRRPINPKTQSITEKKINEGEARSISYSNKLSTNANLRNSSNTGLGKPESRSGNNRVLSTPPKPQELSQSSGKKGNEDKARSIIYSNKLSSNANSRNSSNAGVSKPESRSGISKVVSTPSKPQEPKQSSGSSKTIQAPQQKPNQNEEKLKITNQNIKINSRVTRDVALKDTNLNVHYTDKRHYDVSYTFGNKTQDQDERQSRNLNRVPKSENQNFDHVKNPQNSQYDAIYSIYKSPSPVQDNWGRNKDLHYREDKYQNSQANPVPAWSLQNFQASKENKTESIVQKSIGSNISEIGNERSRRNRFEDDRKNIVHPYNAAYDIKRTDNSYAYGIVCTPKPKSLANCNSGLPNIGNTCYMNSVLQILVSTEGFEGIVAWINQPFFTYLSNIFKLMKSKSGNLASAISQFKNELSSEFSMVAFI
ncbi:unnamed protein product [Blepharisma stoltei]|uniref:USP domain-containing protein n=1 Tax=Blepharisma stoltei TaxID=1481888 RepID=A0AAU9JI94_9CILI|nr:unnamed protein product [Blepharisma stoltei]